MFRLITAGIRAMKAGEQLKHTESWKCTQTLTNVVVTILAFGVLVLQMNWPDLIVSNDDLVVIATGVATIMGIINGYLTMATTTKIGVKSNER